MAISIPSARLGVTGLAGGRWQVISPLAVRTTGFPSSLLSELSSPELGALALKAHLGADIEVEFADMFSNELRRTAKILARIVGLDSFREALAWQNPATLKTFDSLCKSIDAPGRNAKRRDREYRLLRYVSRYCAKTETIGFFGPLGWGGTNEDDVHLRQQPNAPLIAYRKTFAEPWAVRAIGAALEEDPRVLDWLPMRRPAHYSVREGVLLRPRKDPLPLAELELELCQRCDGTTPRRQIISQVSESTGVDGAAVADCLSTLQAQRIVIAGANLPLSPAALEILDKRLSAIGDDDIARLARERISSFLEALELLADSHGDSAAVVTAQAQLAEAFHGITGTPAARKSGMMYAGRGVAYEECLRNLTVDAGSRFMQRLSPSLPGILTISQWVTWAMATAYEEHFRQRWSGTPKRLDEVWFEVLAAFYGSKARPADSVLADLVRRWNSMLLALGSTTAGSLNLDAQAFERAANEYFASPRPGWRAAAIHSPDLQICLHSGDGLETGDYSIVMGEIHVGTSTATGPIFEWPFDGYAISHYLGTFTGKRTAPVFPDYWGRNTGRSIPFQPVAGDLLYAFADVEGAPEAISIVDISLAVIDGATVAVLPDGRQIAFGEFFSFFLASLTIDAWKSLGNMSHTPRISVGGITVMRESWRVDVTDAELLKANGELSSYLAAQRWRHAHGLPDKVYIKITDEVKPFYVDFNSPLTVLAFLVDLRGSMRHAASSREIVISEAFPSPEQAWIVDADGSKYLGEIRMMVVDSEFLLSD